MAREIMISFENGLAAADAILNVGGGTGLVYTTTAGLVHKDSRGNGSLRSVFLGSASWRSLATTRLPLREGYIRYCAYSDFGNGQSENALNGLQIYSGTDRLLTILLDFSGTIRLLRGATLIATSAPNSFPHTRYFLVEVHYKPATIGGFVRIYIDDPGTYTTPTLAFTGDTQNVASNQFDAIGFAGPSGGGRLYLDDCGVNSISLSHIPSSGAFDTNDFITGTTSGAQALVTGSVGLSLILSDYNGVPFLDGEEITAVPSGAVGNVVAPTANYVNGLEPNSLFLANGFQVRLTPAGQGATTQLDNSAGGPTADNWTYVDEIPVNATDYTFSSTSGDYDTYALGLLPSSAQSIKATQAFNYASLNGTGITAFNHVLRADGTDYFSPNFGLTSAYAYTNFIWNVDPGTIDSFSIATINGAEAGFRVQG